MIICLVLFLTYLTIFLIVIRIMTIKIIVWLSLHPKIGRVRKYLVLLEVIYILYIEILKILLILIPRILLLNNHLIAFTTIPLLSKPLLLAQT